MLNTPATKAWLELLELDVHDMNMLFQNLDDGDGLVSYDEFINGVLRCRGGARGVDVVALLAEAGDIHADIDLIKGLVHSLGIRVEGFEAVGHLEEGAAQKKDKASEVKDINFDVPEENNTQLPSWKAFVRSTKFDMLTGCVILINSLFIACNLEYEGMKAGVALNIADTLQAWNPMSAGDPLADFFLFVDHFFCIVFVMELSMRIAAFGLGYFKVAMNWLDIATVGISVFELYILGAVVSSDSAGPDLAPVKLLRLMRLAKVARILRVMKMFHQLRILVTSIVATVGSLAWSIAFLGIIQAICAILMTRLLHGFCMDEDEDLQTRKDVFKYFGSWDRSMFTMHEITLAPGGWLAVGRLLIFKVHTAFFLFFMGFAWAITFAMVGVISAIFLKQTLAAAAGDGEIAIQERRNKRATDVARLKEIFQQGDQDDSGTVDWSEFVNMVQNPRVRAWLGILELDVTDMALVFNLLDDGDGQIEFEEFISGVMKCRGAARGVEVVSLMSEFRTLSRNVSQLKKAVMDHAMPGASGTD